MQQEQFSLRGPYSKDIRGLFEDGAVHELAAEIRSGLRLTSEQALWLFEHPAVFTLGKWASLVSAQCSPHVLYNINRHINPTNICVYSCKFCAYAKKPTEEGAYAYSLEQIAQKTREAAAVGADEVHVVGGLHPRWGLQHFQKILRTIKTVAPEIHIKGFTAVEIFWLSRKARQSVRATLEALREAGLGSLPGGGAEVFDEGVRELITAKMDSKTWLDIHRTAHHLGMHSNATLLYGHVETPAHRVEHFARLRSLQDETSGFNAFIPLAFQPHNNEMGIEYDTLGVDDLRTLAIARLFLDNFSHIKAYWIMLGQDIAQLGTHFGAHDLDGTVYEEKISRAAGGRSGMHLSADMLHRLILSVGKTPRRRNTLYQLVPRLPLPERETRNRRYLPPFFGEDWQQERWGKAHQVLKRRAEQKEICREKLPLDLLHPELWHDLLHAAWLQKSSRDSVCSIAAAVATPALSSLAALSCARRVNRIISLGSSEVAVVYSLAEVLQPQQQQGGGLMPGLEQRIKLLCSTMAAVRQQASHIEQVVAFPPALALHFKEHRQLFGELFAALKKEGGGPALTVSHHEPIPCGWRLEDYGSVLSCAHEQGLRVSGALPLFEKQGGGRDWQRFLEDLAALKDVHCDLWQVVELMVERKDAVTPSEYLQAAALMRLALGTQIIMGAPLLEMPVLSPRQGKGRGRSQHPEEKILGLLMLIGVGDLGLWPPLDWDFHSLRRIAGYVGVTLQRRGAVHLRSAAETK